MNTKLTIRMNKDVIDRAKNYARSHKISLSRLIESYLSSVSQKSIKDIEITPLVKSLSGVVELKAGKNYKMDYADFLADKYK